MLLLLRLLAWLHLLVGVSILGSALNLLVTSWAEHSGSELGPVALRLTFTVIFGFVGCVLAKTAIDFLRQPRRADATSLATNSAVLVALVVPALLSPLNLFAANPLLRLLIGIAIALAIHRLLLRPAVARTDFPHDTGPTR